MTESEIRRAVWTKHLRGHFHPWLRDASPVSLGLFQVSAIGIDPLPARHTVTWFPDSGFGFTLSAYFIGLPELGSSEFFVVMIRLYACPFRAQGVPEFWVKGEEASHTEALARCFRVAASGDAGDYVAIARAIVDIPATEWTVTSFKDEGATCVPAATTFRVCIEGARARAALPEVSVPEVSIPCAPDPLAHG